MAHFSRKHYLHTAKWLKQNIKSTMERSTLAEHYADMFAEDNPRFERKLFYENCDVYGVALIEVQRC